MTLLSGPEIGKACSGIPTSVVVACVECVRCGLVTAEMGSTTKVIFLTHGQADVCFWFFFQEQEWTLQSHSHIVSLFCGGSVPQIVRW